MDLIKYSSDLLCLNLSAYKYSIFSLIISIHNKEKIQDKNEKLFYAEILFYFINRISDINSKSALISELKYQISSKILELKKNTSLKEEEKYSDTLISLLNENLASIKTINDLFSYFKQNLSFMKEIPIYIDYNPKGEKEIEENLPSFFMDGFGIIDIFIKKCLLSFKRLSFPKLIKLYEDIIKFNNEKILINQNENLTNKSKDMLFSEIFSKNVNSFFNSEIFCENNNNLESNSNILNNRLFLMHKFYDYNLKNLYNDNSTTNQTKLHYCLLYLTNLYYDCGYYEHALQILFECVKLSQSNCDHEALLKCFLWLSIIYIQQGDYNLASQCLKTCLIKSFQSNYQLLYLISSIELSNLNLIFGANVGIKSNKKNKNYYIYKDNLEEKIISHSNDFGHLLTNIAEYFSVKQNIGDSKNISDNSMTNLNFNEAVNKNEDIIKLINYTNMHQVINYILEGNFCLSLVYLKIIVKELFEDENSIFNYNNKIYLKKREKIDNNNDNDKIPLKEFDSELLVSLTNLIISIMEFDFEFCSDYLIKICNLNKALNTSYNFSLITNKITILSYIMLNKYLSQNQIYHFHDLNKNLKNSSSIKLLGIYYIYVQKFYSFVHKYNTEEELITIDFDLINELQKFIEECKEYHFNEIVKKSSILLAKVFIKQNRTTEALEILSPMNFELSDSDIENNNYDYDNNEENNQNNNVIEYNLHDQIVATLYQSYLCEKNEMYSKTEILLEKIKKNIEIYGNIEEKYDYYYLLSLHYKSDKYLIDILKYAVLLNNENKIKECLILMKELKFKNYDKIQENIQKLVNENHKYISYANLFNFDADGAVEIIYAINTSNKNFINNI